MKTKQAPLAGGILEDKCVPILLEWIFKMMLKIVVTLSTSAGSVQALSKGDILFN
ncbi:MAG: hypothetical protein WCJ19_02955 [bacterium]